MMTMCNASLYIGVHQYRVCIDTFGAQYSKRHSFNILDTESSNTNSIFGHKYLPIDNLLIMQFLIISI